MLKLFRKILRSGVFHRCSFADFTAMGRKKNRNKNNRNNPLPYKTNETNYAQTRRDNELFLKYYSMLGLMPESEVQEFYNQLKEPLPVTFRITGYKSQATELMKIIRSQFFNKFITPATQTSQLQSSHVDMVADTSGGDSGLAGKACGSGLGQADGAGGLEASGIRPPKCLTWYPDELAWQIDLSRKALRSEEVLAKLHEFLVSETETGNISRQEAVSMIPPLVLDVKSNSKVLDMCAAPGSKTAQLIEYLHKDENSVPEGFVVANDRDNKRCYLMVHQVKRLASPCCLIVNHDATNFPRLRTNSDDRNPEFLLFDRVLCDVPCSGDGTMRKNVDIWRKWTPSNANSLHGLQLKILKRGLEVLEVGGRLVYSTCSMHPVEDEAVIADTLRKCQGCVELVDISAELPNFKTVPGLTNWVLMTKQGQVLDSFGCIPPHFQSMFPPSMFPPTAEEAAKFNLHLCHRILPHHQDTGGFFVAVLRKVRHLPWTKEAQLARAEEKANESVAGGDVAGDDCRQAGGQEQTMTADASATASAAGGSSGDNRKRCGESLQGPQPKKMFQGFKEDPFLFLEPNDPVWPPIRDFYGLPVDFPTDQLMYRCEQGPNRSLYYVNKAVRQLVRFNEGRLRFVNMGVKFVSRSPSPLVPDCDYRITQECMGSLSPLFDKRRVEISKEDAVTIFSEESPFINKLSPDAQKRLEDICPGSVVFTYKPTDSNPEPACEVTFCGWRGKTSVRSFVPRHERSHSLRLFGKDLSCILGFAEEDVRRKKAERQAAWEKKKAEDGELADQVGDCAGPQGVSAQPGEEGAQLEEKTQPGNKDRAQLESAGDEVQCK